MYWSPEECSSRLEPKPSPQALSNLGEEDLQAVPKVGLRHDEQVYILDGRMRTLFAKRKREKSIQAIILEPSKPVEYGVVKAAGKMGLKRLDDIRILS